MTMYDIEEQVEMCTTVEELRELFDEYVNNALELNEVSSLTEAYIVEHFGEQVYEDLLVEAFSHMDREDAFEHGSEPPYPSIPSSHLDEQTNEMLCKMFNIDL